MAFEYSGSFSRRRRYLMFCLASSTLKIQPAGKQGWSEVMRGEGGEGRQRKPFMHIPGTKNTHILLWHYYFTTHSTYVCVDASSSVILLYRFLCVCVCVWWFHEMKNIERPRATLSPHPVPSILTWYTAASASYALPCPSRSSSSVEML